MTRPKRVKQQSPDLRVPQSRDEASDMVAEIGRLEREKTRLETEMNDELAAIKKRFEEQAAPLNDAIAAASRGVQVWCEAHRSELTGGKLKSAVLPGGEIGWRFDPPSVKITGKPVVIESLKLRGLNQFLRLSEDVNREAILADPDRVAGINGIRIVQAEQFYIKPFETALEDVA